MSVVGEAPATPFKGLAAFQDTELDALLFCGREREREVVVANLLASRLTVLYGASGVGKTSLLRAAVAHSLRRIHDAEVVLYSSWAGDPRAGFGEAIDVAAGIESDGTLVERLQAASQAVDGDVYVILDQFEEYFLYHEGDPFAAELAAAIREPGLRAHFLVGLREDALAKLDAFKGQIPNLFANYLRLDHLDRNGARAAILGPIERYNELTGEEVSVEPELVEALLDQVAAGRVDVGRAGRGGVETDEERIEAPYLQLVLERLWEIERESGSNVLRLATLGELGGSESIVRAHLERALGRLQPAEQDVAATMFDHLVTPSGTKIAHRPSDLAQYAAVRENEVMPVLTVLGRERIVRAVDGAGGSERYEIFHDVLADGVLAWRDHYQAQRELDLTRREAARRHRQLLLVVGASLVALAAMATVTIFALTQRSEARSQRHHARAATLISTALAQLGVDPQESLRLARAAAGLDQSPVVETVLRQALLQSRLRLVLPAGGRVTSASFDPAGTRVLTASTNGDARLFDARSGQLLRVLRSRGPVSAAVFSRDGRFVATASADRRVRLWDAASGRPLHVFRQAGAVTGVSFDRSGSLLMSTSANRAQIWKVPSGTPVQTIRQDGPVLGASFSPDGTRVLTRGRKGAGLYDVSSGRLIYALPQRGLMTAAAFSPNGWFIATGGTDHRVRLWYARTGRLRYDLKEQGQVTDVAFGPSSALLATANSNGASHIWNVASGTLVAPAVGQRLAITDASFSPDGKWIVTASRDRTAGIYGVRNGLLINLLRGHLDTVNTASYSPNGNLVVTASDDGTARVWDPGSELQLRLLGHQARACAFRRFQPGRDARRERERRRYGGRLARPRPSLAPSSSAPGPCHERDVQPGRQEHPHHESRRHSTALAGREVARLSTGRPCHDGLVQPRWEARGDGWAARRRARLEGRQRLDGLGRRPRGSGSGHCVQQKREARRERRRRRQGPTLEGFRRLACTCSVAAYGADHRRIVQSRQSPGAHGEPGQDGDRLGCELWSSRPLAARSHEAAHIRLLQPGRQAGCHFEPRLRRPHMERGHGQDTARAAGTCRPGQRRFLQPGRTVGRDRWPDLCRSVADGDRNAPLLPSAASHAASHHGLI